MENTTASWLSQPAAAIKSPYQDRNQKAPRNPNIVKLKITKDTPSAGMLLRMLPRGIEGLQNGLYPSVLRLVHYLSDKRSGVWANVVCRQTIGEPCPVCKSINDHYKAVKDQGNEERAKEINTLRAKEEWYTNVLVRDDEQNPANNGTVKILQCTHKVKEIMYRPLEGSKSASQDSNTQQSKYAQQAEANQDTRRFTPYCHINGYDFTLVGQWNTEKRMPNYENSFYVQQSTPLAYTMQTGANGAPEYVPDLGTIEQIISQCHDLSQFIADVPTAEAAMAAITKFWDDCDAKSRTQAINSYTGAPETPAQVKTNVVDNNQFFGAQPAAPATQFAQPAAPATQFAQPAAPATQFAQPAAPATQFAQPAAPASQFAQPAAPASQFAQPAAPATQFAQPAAPVNQFAQPAAQAAQPPQAQYNAAAQGLPPIGADDDDDLPF